MAERRVDQAVKTIGRLDILVNNTGNQAVNPVDLITWGAMGRGPEGRSARYILADPVCRTGVQKAARGIIVNTSSGVGLGRPIAPSYCAAKEGIVGQSRAVAREQRRFGIRCNGIRTRR